MYMYTNRNFQNRPTFILLLLCLWLNIVLLVALLWLGLMWFKVSWITPHLNWEGA